MSDDEQDTGKRARLGGSSRLPDAWRWRSLATDAAVDLPTMQAAALRLRSPFGQLDLATSLRALAALAEGNHAVARLVQADSEAVRLLEALGAGVPDDAVLAVFPTEPGAVRATAGPEAGTWVLDGTQTRTVHPGALDAGLVTASTDDGDRLFLFRTAAPGVTRDRGPLRTIAPQDPNSPVTFAGVGATPVASAAWSAARRVSYDGMLRDVACWFGSCVWLCRAVEATLAARTDPNDLLRTGRVDVWVYSARLAMRDALPDLDRDPTSRAAEIGARRAAAVTATTVDTVVRLVALLSDSRVSNEDAMLPSRVAQLQIALRRFDAEANLRELGRLLTDPGRSEAVGS